MLVTLSRPSGLGALSLQKHPCGALPAGIRCCESFRGGVEQGWVGCNYTCM